MTQSNIVYLKDYTPPAFQITHSDLTFHLDEQNTRVQARHQVMRRDVNSHTPLELDYDNLKILNIKVDDKPLSEKEYELTDYGILRIHNTPDTFTLYIENSIDPKSNTALSGLYQSADMLCTQCEAQGFRRITPSIDRPDNLTKYTVTLCADKASYPVLLCNGNLIEQGDIDQNSHYTIWQDPFPKPTYLFALVAGKLNYIEDTFTTGENNNVTLRFYARENDIEKCHYAMQALKDSMRWDEQTYGRYYDLDIYNIVAVSDFNMGAMENKSLNIFNTKYVLADPKIATDSDFFNVESVIAHEYFHNWSGNRVTCRDWFQLSLKEGFTVFRDQEFSADQNMRGVTRIDDVNILRSHQFKEDNGPLAHAVRPDSYTAIDNFYTATVYNKGAEVVRMLQTLVGAETFRAGTDLYFSRFDGQAVTTDDFVACMQEVSNMDLTTFKNWYTQAGTPHVDVHYAYAAEQQRLELCFTQHIPDTPGQKEKQPHVIPIRLALLDTHGNAHTLPNGETEMVYILQSSAQTLVFENINSALTPSLFRGFSAPVVVKHNLDDNQLAHLAAHDTDAFTRWEAMQTLFMQAILDNYTQMQKGNAALALTDHLRHAFGSILADTDSDPHLLAKLLQLPNESYLGEHINALDTHILHHARKKCINDLLTHFSEQLLTRLQACQQYNNGEIDKAQIANRALRDICLFYVQHLNKEHIHTQIRSVYDTAQNMTDRNAALVAIANSDMPDKHELLDEFYSAWQHEQLVVDKWLRIQASVNKPETLDTVKRLTEHTSFTADNPNKVYALIGAFAFANPIALHDRDGAGYDFLAHWITKIDAKNPQLAARLACAFQDWQHFSEPYATNMKSVLQQLLANAQLSKNTTEIVKRSLQEKT